VGEPVAEGWPSGTRRLAADVVAQAPLMIGDDVTGYRDLARPFFALYIGGMGARGRNFYHTLAHRLGYGAAADRSRMPTWTAARPRPRRWSPRSCWSRPH